MVKAAIIAHPEEVRAGLSRPVLKKWIHAIYPHTAQVSDASFSTNLSRAIATGEEKKVLVLPKGPSGKVKLAPGAKPKPAKSTKKSDTKGGEKEAAAPAKPAATKKAAAPKKKVDKKDAKKEPTKKSAPPKAKESAAKPAAKKATAPKKASSTTKKVSDPALNPPPTPPRTSQRYIFSF